MIVFGWAFLGSFTIAGVAFVTALITTLLVYTLSRSEGRTEVVTLVLMGIAVNAVAGAIIAYLVFLGDTQAREQIVFWQLGSLNGSRWEQVGVVAPLVARRARRRAARSRASSTCSRSASGRPATSA